MVLISHPAEGRRLSWPEWLFTYQDNLPLNSLLTNLAQHGVTSLMCAIMLPLDQICLSSTRTSEITLILEEIFVLWNDIKFLTTLRFFICQTLTKCHRFELLRDTTVVANYVRLRFSRSLLCLAQCIV